MKVKLINPNFKSDWGRNLLQARGVEDVDRFLNPDESCLQSYWALDNIVSGIDLILNIPQNGRVGIIVDCDVDGFTSATIMILYLLRIRPDITIHHYLHDGKAHGLEEHWKIIQDESYDLLIVPDAGSNDSEYAVNIDCPILVLDHHLVENDAIAENMVIINNQTSNHYNNKNLSGAGVVYQFCRALDGQLGVNYAYDYIDLAALGICGDMMSGLEIENQYFWKQGFSHIKNYFFLTIARKQGYSITGKTAPSDSQIIQALNPMTVAFYIVPLINAMVRVGSMAEKERMMEAFLDGHKMIPSLKRGAKGTLEEAAVESVRECVNARTHQNKFKEEAVMRLEQKIFKHDLLENEILFVRLDPEDQFPSELNGLIAMQLAQRYKKPTIVARVNDEGYVRGSIRGLSNSELTSFKDYLDSTGLFEYVQGHDNAAGCSILKKNLDKLHELANQELKQYHLSEDYYEINFERQALEQNIDVMIKDIAKYKDVWSQHNDEPLIYIKDLHLNADEFQIMGKNSDTVKFEKNGIAYIKFFAKDMIEELKQHDTVRLEIVGKAHMNEWMGRYTPQIMIEAYEIKEDRLIDF